MKNILNFFSGRKKPLTSLDGLSESNLEYLHFSVDSLFRVLLVSVLLLFISLCFNIYFYAAGKDPKIIALTHDLKVLDIVPLDKPIVSKEGLLSWYQKTLTDTFTFSFADWKKRLAEVKDRYSDNAFDAIIMGFKGPLHEIEQKRNTVTAIMPEAPRLLEKRVLNGVLTWIVETKIIITVEGAHERNPFNLNAKAYIIRTNPAEVSTGIIIDKLILSPE